MLEKISYYAATLAETGLALFGIRGLFEQPSHTIRQDLGHGLEIRDYAPAAAVETTGTGATRDKASEDAFRRLFGYITGANTGAQTLAMTVPVQRTSLLIAMTTPVRMDPEATDTAGQSQVTMRFFVPAKHAGNPPVPTDPKVRLVTIPATTAAVLRFSGNPTEQARAEKERDLLTRLGASRWHPTGTPYLQGYDPPFAIPFLKRNEIAVEVSGATR